MAQRFELALTLHVRCVTCDAARGLGQDARLVVAGARAVVVVIPQKCGCGDVRVRVSPAVSLQGSKPGPR